jgi:hypothetical protein
MSPFDLKFKYQNLSRIWKRSKHESCRSSLFEQLLYLEFFKFFRIFGRKGSKKRLKQVDATLQHFLLSFTSFSVCFTGVPPPPPACRRRACLQRLLASGHIAARMAASQAGADRKEAARPRLQQTKPTISISLSLCSLPPPPKHLIAKFIPIAPTPPDAACQPTCNPLAHLLNPLVPPLLA